MTFPTDYQAGCLNCFCSKGGGLQRTGDAFLLRLATSSLPHDLLRLGAQPPGVAGVANWGNLVRQFRFESQFYHLLAVCLWANY